MADCYSIFDSRSSNSIPIHQFYDSTTIWLRYQRYENQLDDERRVGTPIRQNLQWRFKNVKQNWPKFGSLPANYITQTGHLYTVPRQMLKSSTPSCLASFTNECPLTLARKIKFVKKVSDLWDYEKYLTFETMKSIWPLRLWKVSDIWPLRLWKVSDLWDYALLKIVFHSTGKDDCPVEGVLR